MLNYEEIKRKQGGFLSEEQVKEIATSEPLKLLLVRCGFGRFLAPAQNVEHFVGIIEKEGSDHIRDVSLPANC